MTVRISVGLPGPGVMPVAATLSFAQEVEDMGFASLSVANVLAGDGSEALDPVTTLAAVAGGTTDLGLDFGVLPVPTRPLAMVAAQVQALQHLSGGRVRLGLGIGGFADSPFWRAVGAGATGRGRLLDQALDLLPDLIAGSTTMLPGGPEVTLLPGSTVPPLLVGSGTSDAALQRIGARADGWMPSALTPEQLAVGARRLREIAAAHGRPRPEVSIGLHAVLGDDPAARATRATLLGQLGQFFGLAPDLVASVMLIGSVEEVAARMGEYLAAGATEVGVALEGPDLQGQLDLLDRARAMLPAEV